MADETPKTGAELAEELTKDELLDQLNGELGKLKKAELANLLAAIRGSRALLEALEVTPGSAESYARAAGREGAGSTVQPRGQL